MAATLTVALTTSFPEVTPDTSATTEEQNQQLADLVLHLQSRAVPSTANSLASSPQSYYRNSESNTCSGANWLLNDGTGAGDDWSACSEIVTGETTTLPPTLAAAWAEADVQYLNESIQAVRIAATEYAALKCRFQM